MDFFWQKSLANQAKKNSVTKLDFQRLLVVSSEIYIYNFFFKPREWGRERKSEGNFEKVWCQERSDFKSEGIDFFFFFISHAVGRDKKGGCVTIVFIIRGSWQEDITNKIAYKHGVGQFLCLKKKKNCKEMTDKNYIPYTVFIISSGLKISKAMTREKYHYGSDIYIYKYSKNILNILSKNM